MDLPSFDEIFKYMNFNRKILGIDGFKLHLRFYIIAIIYFPILFEEAGYLITKVSAPNFVTLLGLVPCITYCVVSILKIIVMAQNRIKIVELMSNVEQLYLAITKDEKKINIVRSDILFVKTLTKYLFFLNLTLVCVYNFSSPVVMLYNYITQNVIIYDLPYPVIVPFSTEAWIPWFIVYIHSISCGFICILYVTTLDALYFILVTHVCINFTVLSDNFLNLKQHKFSYLNECIRNHQYVIQLSEDLDAIFRLPNFINVLFGSLQICALGFCIMVGEWNDVPGYLLFLLTVLAQLWMTSIFGENVLATSAKINEAVWNCYCNCTDVPTQKIILMVIMRSQKPQKLSAYMFSTICCSSFTKILSNAWSYFSILRSMYTAPPEIRKY